MSKAHLTAIILTRNEAAHIAECIESVGFADEIVVFDSFSDDATPTIARTHDAVVIQRVFDNYTQQRNAALDAVAAMRAKVENKPDDQPDWVLFVDADERIPNVLAHEIMQTLRNPHGRIAGYRCPRQNIIFGRVTRGAGWSPDYQTRLLKLGAAHYDTTRQVHETVVLKGELGTLSGAILHYNYRDLRQFLEKQRRYTAYEARALFDSGIRPKRQNYLLQPLRHFKWRFFALRGYSDGLHGLRLSLLMAWYEFRKYWLLRGLWREADQR